MIITAKPEVIAQVVNEAKCGDIADILDGAKEEEIIKVLSVAKPTKIADIIANANDDTVEAMVETQTAE